MLKADRYFQLNIKLGAFESLRLKCFLCSLTIMKTDQTKKKPALSTDSKTRILPLWNVVLLDDNDHSYDYVIEMLQSVFGHNPTLAFKMAVEVDTSGRVVVFTGPLEHAETKRDRIHNFGSDHRIQRSKGSMSAILEQS